MLCSEWSLVKTYAEHAVAIPLRCRSWTCPLCQPLRQAQLRTLAMAGQPQRFVTLTCVSTFLDTPEQRAAALARAWRVILARWRRQFNGPKHEYLAVFEATKRGQPHLHILVRGPYISQKWLSLQTKELLNSPVCDIRIVKNERQAAHYITKYVGKAPHRFGTCKRYWHTRGWSLVPEAPDDNETGWTIEERGLDQIQSEWQYWRCQVESDGQGGIIARWPSWCPEYYPRAGPWTHAPPPDRPTNKQETKSSEALLGMGRSPHDPSC